MEPKRKRSLARPRRTWENDIKMDLKEKRRDSNGLDCSRK
jgi:hypothetical protein